MPKLLTDVPTASEALRLIADGDMNSGDYLRLCVEAIDEREKKVGAFASIDRSPAAIASGPLSGIPIGVKDVIDTGDLPTECNSPLYQGHQAAHDAGCVSVLRSRGAVVLGKTTTVEFASLGRVARTVNPHNEAYTPGGSSSGSAAAVASGMVPVALGTQTGGSIIRPATFCGVAALKPTFGIVPISGLKPYAPSLDTIGWMARSIEDLRLILDCFDPLHSEETPRETLRIGFYRTGYWDQASVETRGALAEARAILEAAGHAVVDVDDLPEDAMLNAAQDTIMHAEGRLSFLAEYSLWRDRMHDELRDEVENVRRITPAQLAGAYDFLGKMRPVVEEAMSGFDAWLTPAVPGEAPAGLTSTGDAVFNRLWTGLHMPAVALPGFTGPRNLPVGIQLVAPRFRDRALLNVAAILESLLLETS
ncbi:MAG: amidase [Gammaproteobacteria bacterium]|nr:amidase [Gammaproteobacteria bacterium]